MTRIAPKPAARGKPRQHDVTLAPTDGELLADALHGEIEPELPEKAFPDFARREQTQAMMQELGALPTKYRTPLVLRYLEGKTRREIADGADSTIATVAGLLTRGKRLMRTRLARRGISLAVALSAAGLSTKAASAGRATRIATTTANSTPIAIPLTTAASTAAAALAQQGIRTMMLASITKPIATCAALGLVVLLVAAKPDAQGGPPADARGPKGIVLDVKPVVIGNEEEPVIKIAQQPDSSPPRERGEESPGKPTPLTTLLTVKKTLERKLAEIDAQIAEHPDRAKLEEQLSPPPPSPPQLRDGFVPAANQSTAAHQQAVDFYQQLYDRIKGLHDEGAHGGGTEQLALAQHALHTAKANLALAKRDHPAALNHLAAAVVAAERSVAAHQKAYEAGRVTLDQLIDVAEKRTASKMMLEAMRGWRGGRRN